MHWRNTAVDRPCLQSQFLNWPSTQVISGHSVSCFASFSASSLLYHSLFHSLFPSLPVSLIITQLTQLWLFLLLNIMHIQIGIKSSLSTIPASVLSFLPRNNPPNNLAVRIFYHTTVYLHVPEKKCSILVLFIYMCVFYRNYMLYASFCNMPFFFLFNIMSL